MYNLYIMFEKNLFTVFNNIQKYIKSLSRKDGIHIEIYNKYVHVYCENETVLNKNMFINNIIKFSGKNYSIHKCWELDWDVFDSIPLNDDYDFGNDNNDNCDHDYHDHDRDNDYDRDNDFD